MNVIKPYDEFLNEGYNWYNNVKIFNGRPRGFKGPNGLCLIFAVWHAINYSHSFEDVYAEMVKRGFTEYHGGRDFKERIEQIGETLEHFGYSYDFDDPYDEESNKRHTLIDWIDGTDYFESGTFIISTIGHAVCIRDGILYDTGDYKTLDNDIISVIEVTKK